MSGEVNEGFFIGLTQRESQELVDSLGSPWSIYVVRKDGQDNDEIRTDILRPYEVKLHLNRGVVTKAYRVV